jgi:hypothetical protein
MMSETVILDSGAVYVEFLTSFRDKARQVRKLVSKKFS